MEIHKGEKYTITSDGITAEKTDGTTLRHMKYYPERDICAIAGEIDELTAWQLLYDMACQIPGSTTPVSPDHILIDGRRFVLSEWSESTDARYIAPEGYSAAWALAATTFYVFLGCNVFQGLGGRGQSPSAPVPTLRRELPELSQLIVRCLDFDPQKRPAMAEIAEMAQHHLQRCSQSLSTELPLKKQHDNTLSADEIDTLWPEEM